MNSRSLDDVTEPSTPSHLLVGYRILSLPDVSSSDDAGDDYFLEKLTRRAIHFVKTLEKFWKQWKLEYLQKLREFHHTFQLQEATSSYSSSWRSSDSV